MFEPKNELGVLYWFARLHEKLGFEKILHIGAGFPDITALRNGELVRIELEYRLRGFLLHYEYGWVEGWLRGWRWAKKGDYWMPYHPEHGYDECELVHDPDGMLYADKGGRVLKYRSLRDQVDVVVCWIVDCELPEPIEVICLRDYVAKMKRGERHGWGGGFS